MLFLLKADHHIFSQKTESQFSLIFSTFRKYLFCLFMYLLLDCFVKKSQWLEQIWKLLIRNCFFRESMRWTACLELSFSQIIFWCLFLGKRRNLLVFTRWHRNWWWRILWRFRWPSHHLSIKFPKIHTRIYKRYILVE